MCVWGGVCVCVLFCLVFIFIFSSGYALHAASIASKGKGAMSDIGPQKVEKNPTSCMGNMHG